MDKRMNFAPCGYVVLTTQGVITEMNHTFLELLGYQQEELLDQYLERFLSVASKILFHSLFFPQIRLDGRIEELYLTLKHKNGTAMPILLMGNKSDCDGCETIDCVVVKTSQRDFYEKELQDIKLQLEEAYIGENKLRRLFETTLFSLNEGLIVTDQNGVITIINNLAEEYTGWSRELALGNPFADVFQSIDSKTRQKSADIVSHILNTEVHKDTFDDLILLSKEGDERYVSGNAAIILSEMGESAGVVLSFKDITKEYLQEKEIEHFLNVNMEMLCVIDENENFHKINKKFEQTLGYSVEAIVGKPYLSFVHPDEQAATQKAIEAAMQSEELYVFTNRFQCADGTYKYIEWYRQPVAGRYTYSSARDVTDKMKKEEQLLNIAAKDELTGLYNRHFLASYLEQETKQALSERYPLSMAILDLDKFKLVNDTWGHPIGDEQLKHTANIIQSVIRSTDLLVRFGGEEFIVLLSKTPIGGAKMVLEKVRAAVQNNQHPVTGLQTVSIGAAQWHENEPFADWYKRADKALYDAKESGRNRIVTDPADENGD